MQKTLRLVKISELDFQTCVQKNLFGRNSSFLKQWKIGDLIVFVVGDNISGVAKVNGSCFYSEKRLWASEMNSYRLPITFTHVFDECHRPTFSSHKRELEISYGSSWGNVFVLRQSLPNNIVNSILENVDSYKKNNDIENRRNTKEKMESKKVMVNNKNIEIEEFDRQREELVGRMLIVIRNDPIRLYKNTDEGYFTEKLNDDQREYLKNVGYELVKKDTEYTLNKMGLLRVVNPKYGPGTYVVISDTHGSWTPEGVFKLIDSINDYINPKRVFHLGHVLDDNGLINRNLKSVKNLTIITRIDESFCIERFWEKNKNIEVVRDAVTLGGVYVANQDISTDYMTTHPSSPTMRKGNCKQTFILSHHMHGLESPICDEDNKIFCAFTGCLCDKYVESKARDIPYKDAGTLTEIIQSSVWCSRIHRRKFAMKECWEKGFYIVHVAQNGAYTLVPCVIKKINHNGREQFATSYFDKVITEDGVCVPDVKTMITADTHAPLFDSRTIHVQSQVVSDYKPDVYINLGDVRNSDGVSHHKAGKGIVVTEPILKESASVYHVLKVMSEWAPEKILLFGNHERFARDFVKKNPQFKDLVEFEFLSKCKQLGYALVDLQKKHVVGDVVYVHGDLLRGSSGAPLDSLAGFFPNKTVICGHVHSAGIRKGCYSVPYSGARDQEYNVTTVTRWNHGFALCNEIDGVSFVTPLVIEKDAIYINRKKYSSSNDEYCKDVDYDIEINYIPKGEK